MEWTRFWDRIRGSLLGLRIGWAIGRYELQEFIIMYRRELLERDHPRQGSEWAPRLSDYVSYIVCELSNFEAMRNTFGLVVTQRILRSLASITRDDLLSRTKDTARITEDGLILFTLPGATREWADGMSGRVQNYLAHILRQDLLRRELESALPAMPPPQIRRTLAEASNVKTTVYNIRGPNGMEISPGQLFEYGQGVLEQYRRRR